MRDSGQAVSGKGGRSDRPTLTTLTEQPMTVSRLLPTAWLHGLQPGGKGAVQAAGEWSD